MKPLLAAATAVAALLSLAACAENPVAPASEAGYKAISPSFDRDAGGHPYTFTRVDVPLAFQTVPSGVNNAGVIVGWYFSGTGCPAAPCLVKGFIFKDGTFTTVVYHNAAGTDAPFTQLRGINRRGEIVGAYRMAGEPPLNLHGFRLTTGGEFVNIDYPGHTNSVAQRILPNGTILGCYHDADQMLTMHGIVKNRHGLSALDRATTMNNGGTPNARRITGLFTDFTVIAAGRGRGYVLEHGDFTPFDAPGSSSTAAWDMNRHGTIVGLFVEAGTSNTHGYVLEHWHAKKGALHGDFTTIDFPLTTTTNAAYTDVFGINSSGDIVGKFRETATGPFHGYIATRHGEGVDDDSD